MYPLVYASAQGSYYRSHQRHYLDAQLCLVCLFPELQNDYN